MDKGINKFDLAILGVYANYSKRKGVLFKVCPSYGAPWARAANYVKKPQSQICVSCRKLDLRFL